MKKILFSCLFIALCSFVVAQTPLGRAQCEELIKSLTERAALIQTMQCSFVQQKTMTMLSEPIVSEGTLCYSASDKMRWEYTQPYQFALIVNGTQTIRVKEGKAEILDANQGKMYKGLTDLIMGSASGKNMFDTSLFDVVFYDDDAFWRAEMTPKRHYIKRMFNQLVFRFNKQTLIIDQVDFVEPNGDKTTIHFDNILLNEAVDNTVFSIFVP